MKKSKQSAMPLVRKRKISKSSPKKTSPLSKATAAQFIPLSTGQKLWADVQLPKNSADKVPGLIQYLSLHDAQNPAPKEALLTAPGIGFVQVYSQAKGEQEGNALETYADANINAKADDLREVIAWVARQSWCNGFIGIIAEGESANTVMKAALKNPPALKALILINPLLERYGHAHHYQAGAPLTEQLITATALFAKSMSPPPQMISKRPYQQWVNQGERLIFPLIPWLQHPHRNYFWQESSSLDEASECEIPVLLLETKSPSLGQSFEMIQTCHTNTKLIAGPFADYRGEILRWWQRWLKLDLNGIEQAPQTRLFVCENDEASKGYWIIEQLSGAGNVDMKNWYLNPKGIEGAPDSETELQVSEVMSEGARTKLAFETPAFRQPVILCGQPSVELEYRSPQPVACLTLQLYEVKPNGQEYLCTEFSQNLCARESLETPAPLRADKRYRTQIKLPALVLKIMAHSRLKLTISINPQPSLWPNPEPVTCTFFAGPSRINLPLRKNMEAELPVTWPEVSNHHAHETYPLPKYNNSMTWQKISDQEWARTQEITTPNGRRIEISAQYHAKKSAEEPAYAEVISREISGKGANHSITEIKTRMEGSAKNWQLRVSLTVTRGKIKLINRQFEEMIERRLQ